MKKNKITTTILTGAVAMLGATANAQQGPAANGRNVDPPAVSEILPFHVHFSDEALSDLRKRIAATKWPGKETVTDATQGVQFATIKALAHYWQTEYSWRKSRQS